MNAITGPLKRSQTSRFAILRDDETFADEHGVPLSTAAHRIVLVGRSRCRFLLFRAPVGLTTAQIGRAARTYASAHVSFDDAATLLLRSAHGVEIWSWDKSALGELKPAGPESVYRAGGDGWRIVACDEGFEAQYWEAGALVASTWRRGAFTRSQWAAFALSVEGAALDAPDEPPQPAAAALSLTASWRKREIRPPFSWKDAQTIAFTIALCASGVSAFFVGQSLRLDAIGRDFGRQTAELDRSSAADPRARRLQEYADVVAAYRRQAEGADVLATAADAFAVLSRFDLSARAWSSEQERFSVTLNASINDVPLRDIVGALEDLPSLCGVEPNLSSEPGALELVARVESASGCGDATP